MELQTISQVSRRFGVTTRTLRYYEEIGLITPTKKEGFAYRAYDADSLTRLRQVILLRKLRVPLKQAKEILDSNSAAVAVAELERTLWDLEAELAALSTIRGVIQSFLDKLQRGQSQWLLSDQSLLAVMDSLAVSKSSLREEKTMTELNQASEKLSQLTDKDVRIIYLPPAAVASIHRVGGAPETETGDLLFAFIKAQDLPRLKPDFRHFGFNHPDGAQPDGSDHGFERWVTIPETLEVPAPFVKKQFAGGLYAAHMIPMGAFEEWRLLYEWGANHERYEIAWGDRDCMSGFLEEHLDAVHHYLWSHEECDRRLQLDLLLPIREKPAQA